LLRHPGTLSINAIVTPSRELFYWTVILFTFALRIGGMVFGSLIAAIAVASPFGVNPVRAI
jgi:uncharacterized membrane-anchored protein